MAEKKKTGSQMPPEEEIHDDSTRALTKEGDHQAKAKVLQETSRAFAHLIQKQDVEFVLLNGENPPFTQMASGKYVFVASGTCCLDPFDDSAADTSQRQAPCGHEICKRSKRAGISWSEMHLIDYYTARITTEKNERKREALISQRDIGIANMKLTDKEDDAARTRKERIKDTEDQPTLSNEDFILSTKDKGVKEADEDTKDTKSVVRDCQKLKRTNPQCANYYQRLVAMNDTKVSEVKKRSDKPIAAETTISANQASMSFNYPPTPTDLQSIRDAFETPDEELQMAIKVKDESVIMEGKLREQMKSMLSNLAHEQLSEVDKHLTLYKLGGILQREHHKALELDQISEDEAVIGIEMRPKDKEAVLVNFTKSPETLWVNPTTDQQEWNAATERSKKAESDASVALIETCRRMAPFDDTEALQAAFSKIRIDTVTKSEMPHITESVMKGHIELATDLHNAHYLVFHESAGMSDQELSARITSFVIRKARLAPNKGARFQTGFNLVKKTMETAKTPLPQRLVDQLAKVEQSVKVWTEKAKEKEAANPQAAAAADPKEFSEFSSPPTTPEFLLKYLRLAAPAMRIQNKSTIHINALLRKFLAFNPEHAAWALDAFGRAYCYMEDPNPKDWEDMVQVHPKLVFDREKDNAMIHYVTQLYQADCSPAFAVVHISKIIASTALVDAERVELDMSVLRAMIQLPRHYVCVKEWWAHFRMLAWPMVVLQRELLLDLERMFSVWDDARAIVAGTTCAAMRMLLEFPLPGRTKCEVSILRDYLSRVATKLTSELEAVFVTMESIAVMSFNHHGPKPARKKRAGGKKAAAAKKAEKEAGKEE